MRSNPLSTQPVVTFAPAQAGAGSIRRMLELRPPSPDQHTLVAVLDGEVAGCAATSPARARRATCGLMGRPRPALVRAAG